MLSPEQVHPFDLALALRYRVLHSTLLLAQRNAALTCKGGTTTLVKT